MVFSGLLVALILISVLFIQSRISFDLSDHHYHVSLIRGIRKNRHRFVDSHPNFIGEKNFAYPQLFHWICSFLPPKWYTTYYSLPGLIVNLLMLISFFSFLWLLHLKGVLNGGIDQIFLYSGLMLVLTPFSYAGWNAKNIGLSARGFGVLAGYLYNFSLVMLYYSQHPVVYISIYLSMLIILMSSQFTMQYLLLSLIPFSLLFGTFALLLMFVAALLTFYLLMPRIFKKYFIGQYWHKRIFSTYLMEDYIFSARQSIWRDLVWDIYVKFAKTGMKSINYILYQPVLYLFIGIPVHLILVYVLIADHYSSAGPFTGMMLIGGFLFLLTSFRKTRFLGEPERYVELLMPMAVIAVYQFMITKDDFSLFPFLLVFSILVIGVQLYLTYNTNRKIVLARKKRLDRIVDVTMKYSKGKGKILSNSWHIMRYFYSTEMQTLTPIITAPYTGRFHITEIFSNSYTYVSEDVIHQLIEDFGINYLLMDLSRSTEDFLITAEKKFQAVYKDEEFQIFFCGNHEVEKIS